MSWTPNLPTVVLTGVAAAAGSLCLFKDYMSGPMFDRQVRADGKVVVVTGANTGIGREAAWEFAHRGAKVFMACRDMTKCEETRRSIVLETQNKFVYCRECDLASQDSVRRFVERFKSEEPRLDVLVNNAGVMRCPRQLTREGIELQLGVNHMGHFLLTNLLLPTLKASAPSRVVVVSSRAHHKGHIHREDLNLERSYDPTAAYNQSKLANVLFSNELSRRLLDCNVTVNSLHPGLVDTDIVRHMPVAESVSRFLLYPLAWPFVKAPRAGAQPLLHAALDPALAHTTGEYLVDMKVAPQSEEAQDMELALWLWNVSEKWTRLREHPQLSSSAAAPAAAPVAPPSAAGA